MENRKEKIIEIGDNYIITKVGRWFYENRGMIIQDYINQIKADVNWIKTFAAVSIKETMSGTRRNQSVAKYF